MTMTYEEFFAEAQTRIRDHIFEILRLNHVPLDKHRIVYRHCEERLSLSLDTLLVSSINIM